MAKLIALMGPTGAGKSVQGELLATYLGGVHLSSGQLLRNDPETVGLLAGGKLVTAREVHRVVDRAIDQVPLEQPIILDGVPRTMEDVEWLEQELPRHGRELAKVIWIDLDFETSVQRLTLRGRQDDSIEAIRTKYEELQGKTKPVFEHYGQNGLLIHVDGRGTIEAVHEIMKAAVA